jgi:hypothetical protein
LYPVPPAAAACRHAREDRRRRKAPPSSPPRTMVQTKIILRRPELGLPFLPLLLPFVFTTSLIKQSCHSSVALACPLSTNISQHGPFYRN